MVAIAGVLGAGITSGVSVSNARDQRKWLQYMASTAYQRTMQDMRLAGLNPILAYKTGSTQVGPGSAAAHTPDFGKALSEGVQAGAAFSAKAAQVDLMNAQTRTEATRQRLMTSQSQEAISKAHLAHATERGQIFSAKHLEATLPAAAARQAVDESVLGKKLRQAERISEGLWDIVTPGVLRRKRK